MAWWWWIKKHVALLIACWLCSTMPRLVEDRKQQFSISGASWHDKSGHNAANRRRQRLKDKARAKGFDVHRVETSLATPKTCRLERYLEHVGQAIGNYHRLYAHYQQERWLRWETYRREQKTLHEMCMVVRGDPPRAKQSKKNKRQAKSEPQTKRAKRRAKQKEKRQAKNVKKKKKERKKKPRLRREVVVVAIGAAQFGSTMRGRRAVPLKKFLRLLARYVLIVWVDEYRTSRVCSKCSEKRLKERGPEEEENKSAEEKRAEEEAIKQR